MAKGASQWGRSVARKRYAVGGGLPLPDEKRHDIFDAERALREQDVGGGTGGQPDKPPLAKFKRQLEMDEYIPKRREADT